MPPVDPSIHTWIVFALMAGAIVAYAQNRIPLEITSLGILGTLAGLFHFVPLDGADGLNRLGIERLFSGFASPALIAVVSLLIVGQGLVQTGALEAISRIVFRVGRIGPVPPIGLVLIIALTVSAVLNNTPVVVMLIPIVVALADRIGESAARVLMPLSYAAILGGMTTLIGSSTNLLVSGSAVQAGEAGLSFFDFTIPGAILAAIGLVYVYLVVPRLLGRRETTGETQRDGGGKQFIARFDVDEESSLIGTRPVDGIFPSLPGMTVLTVQRGFRTLLPPFEDLAIRPKDVIIVAATRPVLGDAYARAHSDGRLEQIDTTDRPADEPIQPRHHQVMAEVIVAPASRLAGQPLRQIDFESAHRCRLVGIERRPGTTRAEVNDVRLQAGDVLLVQGRRRDIRALRADRDVLLLEWSTRELPSYSHARRASAIFFALVGLAATGIVPIPLAAFIGAVMMLLTGCLNIRQAVRAIDRKVVLIVVSAIALGTAMFETGGAAFLAHGMVDLLDGAAPAVMLSAFFLLVAVFTNILSNHACAVLFTPIAIEVARTVGVDPTVFVIATVLAANCSFATPIGYLTNLLVMTPGDYRFSDFLRAGTPLILLLWIGFSLFAPWYYGL